MWPINGIIILEETTPIAVFRSTGKAYQYVQFMIQENKGRRYSMLQNDGHSTHVSRESEQKEKEGEW